MFCIQENHALASMLRLIADYSIHIELMRDTFGVLYVVITPSAKHPEECRMAEATLQMNCHQSGELTCPVCASKGEMDCCGHLTFTGLI